MHPEVGDTRAGGNRGGMAKTADIWPASSVVSVLLGAWEREQTVRSEAPLQKVPISSSSGINLMMLSSFYLRTLATPHFHSNSFSAWAAAVK